MEYHFSKISKHHKFLAILELGRFWNGLSLGLISVLGSIISGMSPFDITLLFFIWVFLYMGAAAINDYHDSEIDTINMPYRPLQSGKITHVEAEIIYSFMFSIGNLLSLVFFNYRIFIISLLFTVLAILYSKPPFSTVKRGIFAQVKLSFLSIFLPLYSGLVYGFNTFFVHSNPFALSISLTLIYFFLAITKDFKDMQGDSLHGKMTYMLQVGPNIALKITRLGLILSYPLLLFIVFKMTSNISIFFILTLLYFVIIYEILKLVKETNYTTLQKKTEMKYGDSVFFRIRLMFLSIVLSIIYSLS